MGFIRVRMSRMFRLWNLVPLYRVTSRNVSSDFMCEFDGIMEFVDFGHVFGKFSLRSCPYDKYIVYETFPHKDVLFSGMYKSFFQFSHKKVCISWGHFGTHCCALDL